MEGRKYRLGKQAEPGYWTRLPLKPQDLKDLAIHVAVEVTNGQNLMINRVVVTP